MPRQNRKQAYEDAKKQADAAGLCVADVVKVLAFDEAALTVDVQPITRYPDEDTFQTKPPVLAVPVATIYGGRLCHPSCLQGRGHRRGGLPGPGQ